MHGLLPGSHLAARQTAQQAATVPWYASTEYADLAAVADFTNWRFAVTEVLVGSVPGATVAQLKVKREATFTEFFAFTATSTTARYYTNSSGTLANNLAANEPRRDYRNSKQQFRLEDARTNLCLRSEALDNASWAKTGGSISANAVAAPDGNTTAETFTEDTGNTAHSAAAATAAFTSGTTYTTSAFVKAGTCDRIQLRLQSTQFTTNAYANFYLSGAGSVSAAGSNALTTTITALANGWYRITMSSLASATSSGTACGIQSLSTGSETFNATFVGTSRTFHAWGAQCEAGAFASDYIGPTAGASVTRAIETARLSPLLEAILQRTAASVVVRGDLTNTISGDRLFMGGATTVALAKATSTASQVTATNATTALNATLGSGTTADAIGVALGYNASARSLVGNGGTVATDANGPGTLTTVYLARNATNTAATYGDGFYDFVGIAPEKLLNATLQALAVAAS